MAVNYLTLRSTLLYNTQGGSALPTGYLNIVSTGGTAWTNNVSLNATTFSTLTGSTITSVSSIGIGTAAPTQALQIVGSTIVSGAVGIGTANPPTSLYVNGNAFINNNAGVSVPVTGTYGGSGDRIVFYAGGSGIYPFSQGISGSTMWYSVPAGNQQQWYVGGNIQMTLNSSGYLGIGTATPSTALQVAGTVTATGFSGNVTGNCSGSSGSCTGTAALASGLTGSPNIAVGTVKTSGAVGIGTNTPAGTLHVYEASGTVPTGSTGSIYLSHGNLNGSCSIVFQSAVNVGSDYGYIQYIDSVNATGYTTFNYFGSASAEASAFVIGCENDVALAAGPDTVVLRAGCIVLDPNNSTGTGVVFVNGSVGIGKTTPGTALDVAGQIRASGAMILPANSFTVSGSTGTFLFTYSSGNYYYNYASGTNIPGGTTAYPVGIVGGVTFGSNWGSALGSAIFNTGSSNGGRCFPNVTGIYSLHFTFASQFSGEIYISKNAGTGNEVALTTAGNILAGSTLSPPESSISWTGRLATTDYVSFAVYMANTWNWTTQPYAARVTISGTLLYQTA